MMKLILAALLASSFLHIGRCADDSCKVEILDECAANMVIIGKRDIVLPQNTEEILDFCKKLKDDVVCIRNYTQRCLDPLRRQLINMYAASGLKVQKAFCESTKGLETINYFLPCANKTITQLGICMETVIKEFEEIGSAPTKNRIGMMCCRFADYRDCAKSTSKKNCGEKAAELFEDMLKVLLGDFMDIVCAGYEPEGDACKEFGRPEVAGRDPKSQSVVPPVLKILEDFI